MTTESERHTTTQLLARYALPVCLALLAGAAGAAGALGVTEAWARATPPGIEVGAAYFLVDNRGANDRLLRVSSPVAERAELHRTMSADGLTKMRHQHAIDVKAGEHTAFAPGGRHVMLIGLKKPLREGDTFTLMLTFEKAGTLEVPVTVRGIAAMPEHKH